MTTNPSASQIVDSMYALARACCLLANRNCGSGVSRKGGSLSLNSSQYIVLKSATSSSTTASAEQRSDAIRSPAAEAAFRSPTAEAYYKPLRDSTGIARLRDLYHGLQRFEALKQPLAVRIDERHVTDFARGPRCFAIDVYPGTRHAEQLLDGRKPSEQVQHRRVAARGRLAERPAEHGAQVILELTRYRTLDRPVPRVVHARRHLVGEQRTAGVKELDGEHASVVEAVEQ